MAKKFVFFNCHRLLSIVIDFHQLHVIDYHRLSSISIFFGGGGQKQNVLQEKYGKMKLHNSC